MINHVLKLLKHLIKTLYKLQSLIFTQPRIKMHDFILYVGLYCPNFYILYNHRISTGLLYPLLHRQLVEQAYKSTYPTKRCFISNSLQPVFRFVCVHVFIAIGVVKREQLMIQLLKSQRALGLYVRTRYKTTQHKPLQRLYL